MFDAEVKEGIEQPDPAAAWTGGAAAQAGAVLDDLSSDEDDDDAMAAAAGWLPQTPQPEPEPELRSPEAPVEIAPGSPVPTPERQLVGPAPSTAPPPAPMTAAAGVPKDLTKAELLTMALSAGFDEELLQVRLFLTQHFCGLTKSDSLSLEELDLPLTQ